MKVTQLDELDIRLTAFIEQGTTMNHVHVDPGRVHKARHRQKVRGAVFCRTCRELPPKPGCVRCPGCIQRDREAP